MPVLTVGSTARNPGMGDRAKERIRFHLSTLNDFARGVGVEVEHLVVDWNPGDESVLHEDFAMVDAQHHTRRSIRAEGNAVAQIVAEASRPFVEQAAKNLMIEHAAGDWLLIVNSDDALSFALGVAVGHVIRTLGAAPVFVRADRLDVCYESDEGFPDHVDLSDALGRATFLHRRHGVRTDTDPSASVRQLAVEEIGCLASSPRTLDIDLGPAFLCQDKRGPMKGLHTNAAGDFCLARTDIWRASGGFSSPEFFGYGHQDSLVVAALAAHGAQQAVLRFPLFVVHPEHDVRLPAEKYGSFARVEEFFSSLLERY